MAIPTIKESPKSKKKMECISKVKKMLENYTSFILFNCNNVSSNQLKKVRILGDEHGEFMMGKNSLFKKAFQAKTTKINKFESVVNKIYGNIGIFFTNKNMKEMRDLIESISEMAPVKINMIAQSDVTIPKGVTNMSPDKTSFFQALNIATMINKQFIEIIGDIHLLKVGQKVGASEAALMQMLDIRPFSYKINSKFLYDNGTFYPSHVLDIKQEDIINNFKNVISDIACLSLSINYPTSVSIPYLFQNNFSELISLCLAADISNSAVEEYKAAAAQTPLLTVIADSSTAVEPTQEAEKIAQESDSSETFDMFD